MSISDTKNKSLLASFRKNELMRSAFLKVRYDWLAKPFFSPQMEIRMGEAATLKLDYTFGLHRYQQFGDRHNAGFKFWLEACRGKKVVFDIGAHIGLTAIPASKVLAPGGLVYAFEPSQANVNSLRKHIRYNHCTNIIIEQAIAGEQSQEEVDFYEHPQADPMNALVVQKNPQHYARVPRRQISLDDFCRQKDVWPQVVKIDVEGAELKVLKGGGTLWRTRKPLIFLSVHPSRMTLMNDQVEDLQSFVSSWGYTIKAANGEPLSTQGIKFGEYILS